MGLSGLVSRFNWACSWANMLGRPIGHGAGSEPLCAGHLGCITSPWLGENQSLCSPGLLLSERSTKQTLDLLADLQSFCMAWTSQLIFSSNYKWIKGIDASNGLIWRDVQLNHWMFQLLNLHRRSLISHCLSQK